MERMDKKRRLEILRRDAETRGAYLKAKEKRYRNQYLYEPDQLVNQIREIEDFDFAHLHAESDENYVSLNQLFLMAKEKYEEIKHKVRVAEKTINDLLPANQTIRFQDIEVAEEPTVLEDAHQLKTAKLAGLTQLIATTKHEEGTFKYGKQQVLEQAKLNHLASLQQEEQLKNCNRHYTFDFILTDSDKVCAKFPISNYDPKCPSLATKGLFDDTIRDEFLKLIDELKYDATFFETTTYKQVNGTYFNLTISRQGFILEDSLDIPLYSLTKTYELGREEKNILLPKMKQEVILSKFYEKLGIDEDMLPRYMKFMDRSHYDKSYSYTRTK